MSKTPEVGSTDTCATAPEHVEETVGQMLDRRIQQSRERVERLCIIKAKAEASGLLNFPKDFVEAVVFS